MTQGDTEGSSFFTSALAVLAALELLRKLFSQSGLDESDEGSRTSVPFGHRAQNELPIFRESAVSLGDESRISLAEFCCTKM